MDNLTSGSEKKAILIFALPMIIGNVFQQLYNVADTIIVGKFIDSNALAAVGSSFTIMVLLTSIILGLCMGSSAVYSFFYGSKEDDKLKKSLFVSFIFISFITIIINSLSLLYIDKILTFIKIPTNIYNETKAYLKIIFYGISFTSIYNYFAAYMRSIGNSKTPLIFLVISAILNIVLDIIFVIPLNMGVEGAAYATIIAQAIPAFSIGIYCIMKDKNLRFKKEHIKYDKKITKMIFTYSILSSIQQSIMNFGILLIQGLVNTFGVSVMAAFTAVAKIDSFAYMPLQDFGNAFSTFIAQNVGAGNSKRIKNGIKFSYKVIGLYCIFISVLVLTFSNILMQAFLDVKEVEIINIGIKYLFIVAPFYLLIGYLFMFYGLYRGMGRPGISIILTIASLGTRVLVAYMLASYIGVKGIWWSIPIGWALSDLFGLALLQKIKI